MKTVLVLLMMALLSGCAGWQVVQAGVARNGALVADEALETAEWAVCEAPTMGAWQRRYGSQPDRAEAWRRLCSRDAAKP